MDRIARESAIRLLWQNQILKPGEIYTVGGLQVSVLSPGIPSAEEGPDFKGARIALADERPLRGDVEVHVYTSDWIKHRHTADPRYDQTILHVVYCHDLPHPFVVSPSGLSLPTLALEPYLPRPLDDVLRGMDEGMLPEEVPVTFCPRSGEKPIPSAMVEILRRLGWERFEQKVQRLKLLGQGLPPDEILYRAVFEALGFQKARLQMMEMALAIPLRQLSEILRAVKDPEDRRRMGHVWLLAGAGFSEEADLWRALLSPEARAFSRSHPAPQVLSRAAWRVPRIRPAHRPVFRLEGMAELIYKLGTEAWCDGFGAAIAPRLEVEEGLDDGPGSRQLLGMLIIGRTDGPDSLVPPRSRALIGEGCARTLGLNAVLPGLIAAHPERRGVGKAARELARRFPSLPSNRITRLVESSLLPGLAKKPQGYALVQLGMIHLVRTHCLAAHMPCDACPLF